MLRCAYGVGLICGSVKLLLSYTLNIIKVNVLCTQVSQHEDFHALEVWIMLVTISTGPTSCKSQ